MLGSHRRCWVLTALVLASSCRGMPEVAGSGAYVGVVRDDSDGDISIALAVQGRFVALYTCTDDPTRQEYPRWLTDGTYAGDGRIRLTHGEWSFLGALDVDGAEGMLVGPGGTMRRWVGMPLREGSVSGLYTALDSGCVTGVIVIDDGFATPPSVRGAWCNADGKVHQVIITRSPPRLVDGRLPVEVALENGTRLLDAAPVKLPLP